MPVEYTADEILKVAKYWNELLQAMTSDESLKINKTEIDALLKTNTIDFYQHLRYYTAEIEKRIKKVKK